MCGGSTPSSTSDLWCTHPDCLEATEPFANEAALAVHVQLEHSGYTDAEFLEIMDDLLVLEGPEEQEQRTECAEETTIQEVLLNDGEPASRCARASIEAVDGCTRQALPSTASIVEQARHYLATRKFTPERALHTYLPSGYKEIRCC